MQKVWLIRFFLQTLFLPVLCPSFAQTSTQKNIETNYQVWLSLNTVSNVSKNWSALADFHIRRNEFLKEPGFYFIRFGVQYWLKDNITAALGYGHMWNGPEYEDWKKFSNENRIYQQFQFSNKLNKTSLLIRLRNEQRKIQIMEADTFSGNYRTTDRARILVSVSFPVFRKKTAPELLIANEVLMNFGKDVVYNTFDQNRVSIAMNGKINSHLSYDLGYMLVFQQKSSGTDYLVNHTLRLFFYGFFDFRKTKSDRQNIQPISGGE